MPGMHIKEVENKKVKKLLALNKPSWLMYDMGTVSRILKLLYYESTWMRS